MKPNKLILLASRESKLPRWSLIVVAIVMTAYLLLAAGLSNGATTIDKSLENLKNPDCAPKFVAGLDEEFISDSGCPSVIRMVLNVEKIDVVDSKKLTILNRIYPDGDLGMLLENGGVLHESAVLSYDGMGETNTVIPAGAWATGKSTEVNLHNLAALSNYPFDSYKGDWSIIAQSAETGVTLPVWIAAEPVEVAGFNVRLGRNAQPEDIGDLIKVNPSGVGSINYEINRSSSDIFQAILLAVVLLMSLLSSALTSFSVLRGLRPASLGLIGWLATFLFAVIGLRTTFPGNPPIGVNLDKFVTFPVVAGILFFIVAVALVWLKRDDWDMGNELPETEK